MAPQQRIPPSWICGGCLAVLVASVGLGELLSWAVLFLVRRMRDLVCSLLFVLVGAFVMDILGVGSASVSASARTRTHTRVSLALQWMTPACPRS